MRSLFIILLVLIFCNNSYSQKRSKRIKDEKPIFLLDYGAFYKSGETVLDRFGGSRIRPNIIGLYHLSVSRLKIKRTAVTVQSRRKEIKELKHPLIIAGNFTVMYGVGSNLLTIDEIFAWRGFKDSQLAILCQLKIGKQIIGDRTKGLFWLINPSISYSVYKSQDFSYPFQIGITTSDLVVGIGAEINYWHRISKTKSFNIGFEISPTGFVYNRVDTNSPFFQSQNQLESALIVNSVPNIFSVKLGIGFNKR